MMKTNLETVQELAAPQVTRTAAPAPSRLNFSSGDVPLPKALSAASMPGVIIGTLVGFGLERVPLVDFPGKESDAALSARSLIALDENDAGRQVALVFEKGDSTRPLILGRLEARAADTPTNPVNVSLDGAQVTLSAKSEIVLRCGKASITLTHAGKIIIRGAYLLSRSSGANRIKGGSVLIN